jgi:integrase
LHIAVLSGALKSAVKNGLLTRNVVSLADGKPSRVRAVVEAGAGNVLTLEEARGFLAAAALLGPPRPAAFYALLLDSGCRISEAAGLTWADVDFEKKRASIAKQLASPHLDSDGRVQFAPPKSRSRVVDLGGETLALLRTWRAAQAESKLRSGGRYQDHGLAFSRLPGEAWGGTDQPGLPISVQSLREGEFPRLLKAAGIARHLSPHGLRHTCATLLLLAGESAKVVQERLGHSTIVQTLDTYSHVLPAHSRSAADRLAGLLHGA